MTENSTEESNTSRFENSTAYNSMESLDIRPLNVQYQANHPTDLMKQKSHGFSFTISNSKFTSGYSLNSLFSTASKNPYGSSGSLEEEQNKH